MDHLFPVFVYGSLKQGQPSHRRLERAEFLGPGRTQPAFALVDLGRYPGLIADTQSPLAIEGELYRVDAPLLAELDRFEDNGRLYQRELLTIETSGGQTCQAWAYLYLGALTHARRWPSANWSFW